MLQGLGTAMVYPTLLAAIVDHAHTTWRASGGAECRDIDAGVREAAGQRG